MTPEQRKQMVELYLPYLNNNYPAKGKKRKEIECAIMAGALAHSIALGTQDAYLSILLMSGRVLSEELE
jgi:hypothetical protein